MESGFVCQSARWKVRLFNGAFSPMRFFSVPVNLLPAWSLVMGRLMRTSWSKKASMIAASFSATPRGTGTGRNRAGSFMSTSTSFAPSARTASARPVSSQFFSGSQVRQLTSRAPAARHIRTTARTTAGLVYTPGLFRWALGRMATRAPLETNRAMPPSSRTASVAAAA